PSSVWPPTRWRSQRPRPSEGTVNPRMIFILLRQWLGRQEPNLRQPPKYQQPRVTPGYASEEVTRQKQHHDSGSIRDAQSQPGVTHENERNYHRKRGQKYQEKNAERAQPIFFTQPCFPGWLG